MQNENTITGSLEGTMDQMQKQWKAWYESWLGGNQVDLWLTPLRTANFSPSDKRVPYPHGIIIILLLLLLNVHLARRQQVSALSWRCPKG
jgi:hypothetical protein